MLAAYFQDHFNLAPTRAGDIAAVFGLFNVISRPLGETGHPQHIRIMYHTFVMTFNSHLGKET